MFSYLVEAAKRLSIYKHVVVTAVSRHSQLNLVGYLPVLNSAMCLIYTPYLQSLVELI